jgi:hypothetical protein
MNLCEICQKNEARVHLKMSETKTRHICMECHNNQMAEEMEIKLIPFREGEYEFTGARGKKYRFYIDRRVDPVGIRFEANEITAGDSGGFRVAVMDGVDGDQQRLFEKLKQKVEKTICKRYLKTATHPYGGKWISFKEDDVAGRIEYDEEQYEIPKVVIDGKEFTWKEFGRMLNTYQSFQFKLRIYDITDDVD